jgi:hypothetical protein
MTFNLQDNNPFAPAKMMGNRLRIALDGPAGSGKTFTALMQACLVLGGSTTEFGASLSRRDNGMARIAVIDTERGSASKYAKYFASEDGNSAFDALNLARQDSGAVEPKDFIAAIDAARTYGYEAIIVDSLSHAWEGILDQKDKVDDREKSKNKGFTNSFANWREITPLHNRLIDAILNFPGHVFATMRTKVEYIQEKDDKTGKLAVKKVGLKPIQRDGVDYEFDIVLDMMDNIAYVGKSRCKELMEKGQVDKPAMNMAQILREWLDLALPVMSREQFMEKMASIGISGKDSIQEWIKANKLEAIGGNDKYTRLWEIANEDNELPHAAGE